MGQRRLKPFVDHFFHLMGIIVVHRGGPKRIADQFNCLMVVLDFRVLAEDRRVMRVFDMLFQTDGIRAGQADQFEQEAKQVAIVRWLPGDALEDLAHVFERVFDRGQVVGDEEGTDRRTADHDHFKRQGVDDRSHFAAVNRVTPENHDEDDDDAYDSEHVFFP